MSDIYVKLDEVIEEIRSSFDAESAVTAVKTLDTVSIPEHLLNRGVFKMEPSKEVMGHRMIESKPRVISEEEATDHSLVIGVCKCPLPTTYGHVFKKSDYPDGRISYICTECGTKTDLIFKPGFFSRVTVGPFLD